MKNMNKVLCLNKTMIFITCQINKATRAKKVNKAKRKIHRLIKLLLKIFPFKTNHHCRIQPLAS